MFWKLINISNRYFTRRSKMNGEALIQFSHAVDPENILTNALSNDFVHIQENVVEYYEALEKDNAGNSVTSRLLLPCQLTCALHSQGIDVVHDPYPLWVFNLWNPMYILTHTCRLPWPVSRLRVSGGYRYRSSWSDLGVTRADHYLVVGWT